MQHESYDKVTFLEELREIRIGGLRLKNIAEFRSLKLRKLALGNFGQKCGMFQSPSGWGVKGVLAMLNGDVSGSSVVFRSSCTSFTERFDRREISWSGGNPNKGPAEDCHENRRRS